MDLLGLYKIMWICLCIQLISCGTIKQHSTNTNGDKISNSWTSKESEEERGQNFRSQSNGLEDLEALFNSGTSLNIKPQSETILIGGSNIPNEELIKRAGIVKGMDPIALDELLRTKQPVIKSTVDEQGNTRTTTYKLEPNGSISSRTVTEMKPVLRTTHYYDVPTFYPSPTVPTVNQPNLPTQKIAKEWEWATPTETETRPFFNTDTSFHTPTDNWPNFDGIFERRHKPVEETTTVKLPQSWNPQTWPTHMTPTHFTPTSSFDTNLNPSFDGIDTKTPGTVTKTFVDENGNRVTTTYTVEPTKWTRKTVKYPSTNWINAETTRKTIPGLDDFLKAQYDTTTKATVKPTGSTITTTTKKPTLTTQPTTHSTHSNNNNKKSTTTINIDDLPATQVVPHIVRIPLEKQPGTQPILTTNLRPTESWRPAPTAPSLIPHIPISEFASKTEPHVETNVKSLTRTIESSHPPTAADLDPNMQELLQKAGINPDELASAQGNTITKTRVEPDGKIVTTSYRVRTIPHTVRTTQTFIPFDKPQGPYPIQPDSAEHASTSQSGSNYPAHHYPGFSYPTHTQNTHQTFEPPALTPSKPEFSIPTSHTPAASDNGAIEQYLSKVGLSVADILGKNGEIMKTIVDDQGRILTATFVLSSVKNANEGVKEEKPEKKPIK